MKKALLVVVCFFIFGCGGRVQPVKLDPTLRADFDFEKKEWIFYHE